MGALWGGDGGLGRLMTSFGGSWKGPLSPASSWQIIGNDIIICEGRGLIYRERVVCFESLFLVVSNCMKNRIKLEIFLFTVFKARVSFQRRLCCLGNTDTGSMNRYWCVTQLYVETDW